MSEYDVYMAAPVVGMDAEKREQVESVMRAVINKLSKEEELMVCYTPWLLKIPNAWNMPQNEWARCVFTQDVLALDESETVIVCDYGRHASCGTAWEAGYAFAKGKKVIVVTMPGVEEVSLMVHNGCTPVVSYEDFIALKWDIPDYRNAENVITQN